MTPVWSVPTGDAGTDGSAEGGASARMGYVAGTTDDDQVSVRPCVGINRVGSGGWRLESGRGGMESERVGRGLRDAGKQRPRAPGRNWQAGETR